MHTVGSAYTHEKLGRFCDRTFYKQLCVLFKLKQQKNNTVGIQIQDIWMMEQFKFLIIYYWPLGQWGSKFLISGSNSLNLNIRNAGREKDYQSYKMASIFPVLKWSGCPVFKWHSKTTPFGIWPLCDHFNTRLVWYSDPHCRLKG